MTTVALIVAETLTHAVNSAVTDWGWTQIATSAFETPAGECVRYADDHSSLRGQPRGTRIYLGHRWHVRRDVDVIRHLIDSGALIEAQPIRAERTHG